MIVGFFIFVIIVALVAGFFLGCRREEATVSNDIIEKINFAMGTENKSLKEENDVLKKKNLFFSDWFIRSYIEQHHRRKLAMGDERLYTADALEDLKSYAKDALNNFEKTWNSEVCNEQCTWIKDYLEELISKIDAILNDKWGGDVIDSENEHAFSRFFVAIETVMMFDRNAKEADRRTMRLTYWKPQREHEDLC
jgi:hypothetical protein